MKTIKVLIEETISQVFDVEVPDDREPYDVVAEQYYKGNLVLEPGDVEFKQMMFMDEDGLNTISEAKEF